MKAKIWGFVIVLLALVAYANLAAFLAEREEAKMKEAYEESVRKATAEVEREMARLEKINGPRRKREMEDAQKEAEKYRRASQVWQQEYAELQRQLNDPATAQQRAINAANYERVMNPQRVVYVERQSGRIPPGLSDYEQALFKTRQQHTDEDLYSEYEARRQQEMAEAQRQHNARLEAEIQALRSEIRSRPSTDNSSEITDMNIQIRKLREEAAARFWQEGAVYKNH